MHNSDIKPMFIANAIKSATASKNRTAPNRFEAVDTAQGLLHDLIELFAVYFDVSRVYVNSDRITRFKLSQPEHRC